MQDVYEALLKGGSSAAWAVQVMYAYDKPLSEREHQQLLAFRAEQREQLESGLRADVAPAHIDALARRPVRALHPLQMVLCVLNVSRVPYVAHKLQRQLQDAVLPFACKSSYDTRVWSVSAWANVLHSTAQLPLRSSAASLRCAIAVLRLACAALVDDTTTATTCVADHDNNNNNNNGDAATATTTTAVPRLRVYTLLEAQVLLLRLLADVVRCVADAHARTRRHGLPSTHATYNNNNDNMTTSRPLRRVLRGCAPVWRVLQQSQPSSPSTSDNNDAAVTTLHTALQQLSPLDVVTLHVAASPTSRGLSKAQLHAVLKTTTTMSSSAASRSQPGTLYRLLGGRDDVYEVRHDGSRRARWRDAAAAVAAASVRAHALPLLPSSLPEVVAMCLHQMTLTTTTLPSLLDHLAVLLAATTSATDDTTTAATAAAAAQATCVSAYFDERGVDAWVLLLVPFVHNAKTLTMPVVRTLAPLYARLFAQLLQPSPAQCTAAAAEADDDNDDTTATATAVVTPAMQLRMLRALLRATATVVRDRCHASTEKAAVLHIVSTMCRGDNDDDDGGDNNSSNNNDNNSSWLRLCGGAVVLDAEAVLQQQQHSASNDDDNDNNKLDDDDDDGIVAMLNDEVAVPVAELAFEALRLATQLHAEPHLVDGLTSAVQHASKHASLRRALLLALRPSPRLPAVVSTHLVAPLLRGCEEMEVTRPDAFLALRFYVREAPVAALRLCTLLCNADVLGQLGNSNGGNGSNSTSSSAAASAAAAASVATPEDELTCAAHVAMTLAGVGSHCSALALLLTHTSAQLRRRLCDFVHARASARDAATLVVALWDSVVKNVFGLESAHAPRILSGAHNNNNNNNAVAAASCALQTAATALLRHHMRHVTPSTALAEMLLCCGHAHVQQPHAVATARHDRAVSLARSAAAQTDNGGGDDDDDAELSVYKPRGEAARMAMTTTTAAAGGGGATASSNVAPAAQWQYRRGRTRDACYLCGGGNTQQPPQDATSTATTTAVCTRLVDRIFDSAAVSLLCVHGDAVASALLTAMTAPESESREHVAMAACRAVALLLHRVALSSSSSLSTAQVNKSSRRRHRRGDGSVASAASAAVTTAAATTTTMTRASTAAAAHSSSSAAATVSAALFARLRAAVSTSAAYLASLDECDRAIAAQSDDALACYEAVSLRAQQLLKVFAERPPKGVSSDDYVDMQRQAAAALAHARAALHASVAKRTRHVRATARRHARPFVALQYIGYTGGFHLCGVALLHPLLHTLLATAPLPCSVDYPHYPAASPARACAQALAALSAASSTSSSSSSSSAAAAAVAAATSALIAAADAAEQQRVQRTAPALCGRLALDTTVALLCHTALGTLAERMARLSAMLARASALTTHDVAHIGALAHTLRQAVTHVLPAPLFCVLLSFLRVAFRPGRAGGGSESGSAASSSSSSSAAAATISVATQHQLLGLLLQNCAHRPVAHSSTTTTTMTTTTTTATASGSVAFVSPAALQSAVQLTLLPGEVTDAMQLLAGIVQTFAGAYKTAQQSMAQLMPLLTPAQLPTLEAALLHPSSELVREMAAQALPRFAHFATCRRALLLADVCARDTAASSTSVTRPAQHVLDDARYAWRGLQPSDWGDLIYLLVHYGAHKPNALRVARAMHTLFVDVDASSAEAQQRAWVHDIMQRVGDNEDGGGGAVTTLDGSNDNSNYSNNGSSSSSANASSTTTTAGGGLAAVTVLEALAPAYRGRSVFVDVIDYLCMLLERSSTSEALMRSVLDAGRVVLSATDLTTLRDVAPELQTRLARPPKDATHAQREEYQATATVWLTIISCRLQEVALLEAIIEQQSRILNNSTSQRVHRCVCASMVEITRNATVRASPRLDEFVEKCMKQVVHSGSYVKKKAHAWGIAGVLSGLGVAALRRYGVVDVVRRAAARERPSSERAGAMVLLEVLFDVLGCRVEPYALALAPVLLEAVADADTKVSDCADDASRALMQRGLSSVGLRQLIPRLIEMLSSAEQAKRRVAPLSFIGYVAFCSPKQLAATLPQIMKPITACLFDVNGAVVVAAARALRRVAGVVSCPEIQEHVELVLQALRSPSSETESALDALLYTRFVNVVDAASLALIIPVLARGLSAQQQSAQNTRAKAAQIVAAMVHLVADAKTLQPYADELVRLLEDAATDPHDEARTTAARALAALASALGDGLVDAIASWCFAVLQRVQSNATEKAGAAQVFVELVHTCGSSSGGNGSSSGNNGSSGELLRVYFDVLERGMLDERPPVREGFLSILVYAPSTLRADVFEGLLPVAFPWVLEGLSHFSDKVRDVALTAGDSIIALYGTRNLSLVLEPLLRGVGSEATTMRQSSLLLSAKLMLHLVSLVRRRMRMAALAATAASNDVVGDDAAATAADDAAASGETMTTSAAGVEAAAAAHGDGVLTIETARSVEKRGVSVLGALEDMLGTPALLRILAALYCGRNEHHAQVRGDCNLAWQACVASIRVAVHKMFDCLVDLLLHLCASSNPDCVDVASKTIEYTTSMSEMLERLVEAFCDAYAGGGERERLGSLVALSTLVQCADGKRLMRLGAQLVGCVLPAMQDSSAAVREAARDVFARVTKAAGARLIESAIEEQLTSSTPSVRGVVEVVKVKPNVALALVFKHTDALLLRSSSSSAAAAAAQGMAVASPPTQQQQLLQSSFAAAATTTTTTTGSSSGGGGSHALSESTVELLDAILDVDSAQDELRRYTDALSRVCLALLVDDVHGASALMTRFAARCPRDREATPLEYITRAFHAPATRGGAVRASDAYARGTALDNVDGIAAALRTLVTALGDDAHSAARAQAVRLLPSLLTQLEQRYVATALSDEEKHDATSSKRAAGRYLLQYLDVLSTTLTVTARACVSSSSSDNDGGSDNDSNYNKTTTTAQSAAAAAFDVLGEGDPRLFDTIMTLCNRGLDYGSTEQRVLAVQTMRDLLRYAPRPLAAAAANTVAGRCSKALFTRNDGVVVHALLQLCLQLLRSSSAATATAATATSSAGSSSTAGKDTMVEGTMALAMFHAALCDAGDARVLALHVTVELLQRSSKYADLLLGTVLTKKAAALDSPLRCTVLCRFVSTVMRHGALTRASPHVMRLYEQVVLPMWQAASATPAQAAAAGVALGALCRSASMPEATLCEVKERVLAALTMHGGVRALAGLSATYALVTSAAARVDATFLDVAAEEVAAAAAGAGASDRLSTLWMLRAGAALAHSGRVDAERFRVDAYVPLLRRIASGDEVASSTAHYFYETVRSALPSTSATLLPLMATCAHEPSTQWLACGHFDADFDDEVIADVTY